MGKVPSQDNQTMLHRLTEFDKPFVEKSLNTFWWKANIIDFWA